MLSPASPWSSSLRNISTPVTTVLVVSLRPTISTSSPTLMMPRSTRPVATVPRPEIENTSSTGIRKGLSLSRCGSGMYESIASISSKMHLQSGWSGLSPFASAFKRAALDDRRIVAREIVGAQQLANFKLDQLQKFRVVHHVALVHEHDQVGNVDLTGQKHVLAGLRHRAVRRAHHQDRAVHLRRTRDHVLDVVGVAGAVDVRVVTLGRLVLHVRRRDRDAALAFFRRLVDLVERRVRRHALLGQHPRDRRRQRRLAVVDVPDRTDVDVRLFPLEFFLRHLVHSSVRVCRNEERPAVDSSRPKAPVATICVKLEPTTGIEPVTSSLPRKCSAD